MDFGETTLHNRHNGLLHASTCYGLVTDLRESYGETDGVMDFGHNELIDWGYGWG